jgi:hypothetical protein
VLGVTSAPIAIVNGAIDIGPGSVETLTIAAGDAPATATTTCTPGVATIAGSPGASLTLTGVGAGSCALTLSDSAGKTVTLHVYVSSASLPVE